MDHRPRYHFTAPRHWLNDPNGIVHWQGRWHLHYQHNPQAPRWGLIHWGHASSDDLVHWRDEPLALAPSPGLDEDGCWSGSIAVVDGLPTAFYTGCRRGEQAQCVATSPDLRHWTKDPARAITEPPAGVGRTDFRDPYVFRHEGGWWMVVGASWRSERGQCLLYRSADGRAWQYRGALFTAPELAHGVLWECPNLLRFGERWLLTVSVWPNLGARWFSGRLDGETFVPEREGLLDVDGGAFAHLAALAPDGRTLQWAWIAEQRDQPAVDADGWAGALSVPREIGLDAAGRPTQRPAAELARLRGAPLAVQATGAARGVTHRFAGRCLELEASFVLRDRRKAGLVVCAAPDGSEATRIVVWPDARRLVIERARSSADPAASRQNLWAPLEQADGEPLVLRVLLDHSVLEVYAGERVCLTMRIYPASAQSTLGEAFVEGDAELALRGWTMGGALPWRAGGPDR